MLVDFAGDRRAIITLPNTTTSRSCQMQMEYLLADDLTLTFCPDPGCWIDTVLVGDKAGPASPRLEEQVAAYQSELRSGFYDDWITIERALLQDTECRVDVHVISQEW